MFVSTLRENQINYLFSIGLAVSINLFSGCQKEMLSSIIPVIKTIPPDSITHHSVRSGAQILWDGESDIQSKGLIWSTDNPLDISVLTKLEAGAGKGDFSLKIENLWPAHCYKIRAFAINGAGIGYGDILSFKTLEPPACDGTPTVKDRDGNQYGTVQIGNQCWMRENLRVSTYRDGHPIDLDMSGGSDGNVKGETWSVLKKGSRTVYGHSNKQLENYGYLYNWYAVSDARGLCPTGWHIPTINEWTNLIDQLAGEIGSVSSLKAVGSRLWKGPNTANNSSGFSGLPGGWRFSNGQFRDIREFGFFWSSTEGESETAWYRYLDLDIWDRYIIRKSKAKKSVGGSVRCLKD